MKKGKSNSVLRTTVLAAALLVAFGQAYAGPTNSLLYTTGDHTLSDSPYTDTTIDVSGSGTSLSGVNVDISGAGDAYTGDIFRRLGMVVVKDGASLSLTGDNNIVTGIAAGPNFRLVSVTGEGTEITLTNTHLSSTIGGSGSNSAAGLMVYIGAKGTVAGGSITTHGTNNRGLVATNNGTIVADEVTITTAGKDSHAVALDFDQGHSSLEINDSTIITTGDAYGIQVINRGDHSASGEVTGSGNTIKTAGHGLYVNGAGASLDLAASHVTTAGDQRHAAYAKDGGSIDLTGGSLNTSGFQARALYAEGVGSTVTTTNTVLKTTGTLADGVQAYDGGQAVLSGGSVTAEGNMAKGVTAGNNALITLNDVDVSTKGATNADGVQAFVNLTSSPPPAPGVTAQVHVHEGSVSTIGTNSAGLSAAFHGALVSATGGTKVSTTGNNSHGAKVELGARIELSDGVELSTTGAGSRGLSVTSAAGTDAGTDRVRSTASVTNSSIDTTGDNAVGVYVDAGGMPADGDTFDVTLNQVDIKTGGASSGLHAYGVHAKNGGRVAIDGGSIETRYAKGKDTQDGDGSRAYAIFAEGAGSTVTATNTIILTQGQRAYGAYATNGGNVELTGESITTHGFMAYGVYASGAGSTVTTNNVNIVTTGQVGDAVWAYQGGEATINGGDIWVHGNPNPNAPGETSNGVRALGGNEGVGDGVANVRNASITTTGNDSAGVLAGGKIGNALTSGTVNLNNTQVEVTGEGSVAASVVDGSTLTASDGSRLVSALGNGIEMRNNATVTLSDTIVQAGGASLLAGVASAGQTQNISIGGGSVLTQNNGTLLQVNRAEDGSNGVVNLTLSDGALANGDIRDLDSKDLGGKTHFILQDNARWTGGLFGVEDFEIRSGSLFIETGGQVNTDTLAMDDGVKVAFTNGVTLTGQFVAKGGTQANFSGASKLNSGVKVDGPTSVFTGNGATISVPGTSDMQAGVNASNGATVHLTGGSVAAKGTTNRTRGILASTGAKVTATDVAISTTAAKSHAVHAFVEKDNTAAVPVVTINGGTISTQGNESWGLYALRGGQITSSANITTKGKAGFGAFVEGNDEANARGGKITLNGGSITTTGQQLGGTDIGSFGVLAKNMGNHVEINGTRISTAGAHADGLRAEDKATIKATNAQITVSGGTNTSGSHANGHGVAARGGSIELAGGSVTTKGQGYGLVSTGVGSSIVATDTTVKSEKARFVVAAINGGTVELRGGSVVNASTAADSRGATAQGAGSVLKASNTAFTVAGVGNQDNSARGLYALDGGAVILEGGSVRTTGAMGAHGMRADTASLKTSGVAVTTVGAGSHGIYANLGGHAEVTGGTVNTSGQGAHGVYVRDQSTAALANTKVTTAGANASALMTESLTATARGGDVVVGNSQLKTTGANAHGVSLMGGSSLTMTGGSIEASGAGSSGLFIHNQSSATLNGVKVVAAGPSITSRFRADRQQQITIGAGSELTQNNGTLLQVNRETGGEQGTIKLSLLGGSFSAGNVVDLGGSKQVAVTKEADAHWAGIVVDKNTKVISDGDAQEFSDEPIDGDVASGEGSTVSFNDGANISGSVSSGINATTTFSGDTNIGGDTVGQQGSSSTFGGPTQIGGSVTGASSSTFTFSGPSTSISGSVAGAQGSSFSFSGPADIGGSVSGGAGSNFAFNGDTSIGGDASAGSGSFLAFTGPAAIGGSLSGAGASFSFSPGAPSSIGGDVALGGGSSISGGSAGAPIQIGGDALVNGGSTLGGNLNIAGMVSGAGAILGPGNSIGVHTYGSMGELSGTYVAEVNAA
ncbi:MAG: hypothetical protein WBF88_11145, partial [Pusillimonas sp.]